MSSGSVKQVNSNNFDTTGTDITGQTNYECLKDGIIIHESWGTNTSFVYVNNVCVMSADYGTRGRTSVRNSFRVNKGDIVKCAVWYEADQYKVTFYGAN